MNNFLEKIKALPWNCDVNKILALQKKCIQLNPNKELEVNFNSSKLGGLPDLPIGALWPQLNSKPLAFLGQINFSELSGNRIVPDLFFDKMLYFFLSIESNDYRHEYPVIHKTIVSNFNSTTNKTLEFPSDLKSEYRFSEVGLSFKDSFSFPSYEHWKIEAINLDSMDSLNYEELEDFVNEELQKNYQPGHKLFGYSDAIQGDTNLNWSRKMVHKNESRIKDTAKLEREFELLLQLDLMEEATKFHHFSDGCVYFGFVFDENKKADSLKIECELQNT